MEQSQFIALTMNAFQIFRAIVPIDTGNMRYNATRYVQYSDAVEIRVDARTPVAPGCVGGKRVAESVRSSGANGGTDSGEGLTAGVGCDKLLEIGKDVMI